MVLMCHPECIAYDACNKSATCVICRKRLVVSHRVDGDRIGMESYLREFTIGSCCGLYMEFSAIALGYCGLVLTTHLEYVGTRSGMDMTTVYFIIFGASKSIVNLSI